jgi:two-component system sensor histidine kinase UhpB
MRRGHFDVVLDRTSPGELGELQAATLEVARTLGTSQRELELQVAARTSELEQAVALANEAHADRLALVGRWNAALEDERKRIAVEIHDHLNAALIAVKMRAEHIGALAIDSPTPEEVAEIRQTAQATAKTVETLYAAARRIIKQLRPEVIDTLGLKGALAGMIREYDELHAGCQFVLSVEPGFPDVRGNDAMTAYRLVQEALSNVVKHAGARTANVAIAFHSVTRSLHVAVEDDGKGFDTATRPAGSIGLIGMRERVSACGGSMEISASVGSGTKVVFILPIGEQTLAAKPQ